MESIKKTMQILGKNKTTYTFYEVQKLIKHRDRIYKRERYEKWIDYQAIVGFLVVVIFFLFFIIVALMKNTN